MTLIGITSLTSHQFQCKCDPLSFSNTLDLCVHCYFPSAYDGNNS